MAAVEILVHYSVLPMDFVITPILLPDGVSILDVPENMLVTGWDQPTPIPMTVLRVPSAVVRREWNYVINVHHPGFLGRSSHKK